jgi:hypothetical protein
MCACYILRALYRTLTILFLTVFYLAACGPEAKPRTASIVQRPVLSARGAVPAAFAAVSNPAAN